MHPHSLEFTHKSPLTESPVETPPKRRVFGEIQNSQRFLSPNLTQKSPVSKTPVKQVFSTATPLKTSLFNFNTNSNVNTNNSPLKQFYNRISPVNRVSPVNRIDSPLNRIDSPLNRIDSPLNRINSPVNRINTPVNRISPVDRISPVNRINTQVNRINTPVSHRDSPLKSLNSPKLNAPFRKRSTTKLTKVFEERTKFKMASNKENKMAESFMKIESTEETTSDSAFDDSSFSPGRVLQKSKTVKNWSLAQVSFYISLLYHI